MWRTLAAAGPQQFSGRPAGKRRKPGDPKSSRKQPTRSPGGGGGQRRHPEARDTELRKHPELYSLVIDQGNANGTGPAPPTPASRPAAASPAVVTLPAHKPEVLAPAGGWPQLRAAVENGADAVYFGLTAFNARARAANFEPEELAEVMGYLHDRGAKGYLVLNVLVFDEELQRVQQVLRGVAAAGVDAIIVQDSGLVELARRLAPGLPVHGSTQMSITSAEGAAFAAARGVERVVVGRELSVRDISRVSAGGGAEVEAFVQGALCVSYSGQCFSSEAWGGRSANRGQCAQACRLPYGLVVGGALADLGDMRYLLSPQDLAAVELVPELVQAGVTSFKIEGRLKGPEYVAATVQVYRRAVDAAWAALTAQQQQQQQGRGGGEASASQAAERGRLALTEAEWRDLRQVFARGQDGEHGGLTPGFLEGSAHQRLVRGRSPRHRGTFLGTVQRVTRSGAVLQLRQPVRRGCGVVFDAGDPQREEQGGSVFGIVEGGGRGVEAAMAGATVELQFGRGQVDLNSVAPGQLVWQTKDPALEARLRASYDALPAAAQRRLPVAVAVAAAPGRPMRVTLTDGQGCSGSGESNVAAEAAAARPLSEADVRRAVGQHLGGDSPLAAESWDLSGCQLEPGLFLPAAAIKEARRRAVAALMAERRQRAAATAAGLQEGDVVADMLEEIRQRGDEDRLAKQDSSDGSGGGGPVLRVLCRSKAQVDAALALPWLREVVLDFLEVHGLKEACEAVRAAGKRLVVATPRILKPGEQRLCLFYLRLGADALLLRSAGLLHQLMEAGGPGAVVPGCEERVPQLEGDFSLNATNVLSADLLLNSGLSRLAPTHDCNAAQLQQLARHLGARGRRLEAVLHQHLPIFHTEHCVFCRFLSDGNDYRDCGHPCESNTVHLRDDKGRDHLVLADMGCRNTVFDASAQSGLPHLAGLVAAGFGTLRVELVDEPAEYVAPLLEGYRNALQAVVQGGAGGGQHAQFWRWMQELPDANGRAHGVGLGSLEVRAERSSQSMKPTAASLR